MDFDSDLVKLTGVLRSSGWKITDQKVLEGLREIFQNQSKNAKSKMVFFMVLNTELKVSDCFQLDDNVYLLSDMCPKFNVPDLMTVIIDFELIEIISDIIRNCPSSLSLELLHGLFNKFIKLEDSVKGLNTILVAIYSKIEKIELGLEKDIYLNDYLSAWEMFVDAMIDKCRQDGDKDYDNSLHLFQSALSACISCVELSKSRRKKIFCDNPIYILNNTLYQALEHETEFKGCREIVSNTYSESHLRHCLTKVLDSYSDIIDSMKENGGLTKEICESAYLLFEEVKDEIFAPDNLNCLELIKREPEAKCVDKIESDSIDLLLSKVNASGEARRLIVKDLLDQASDIKCRMEAIETVCKEGNGCLSDELVEYYFMCFERLKLEDQLVYFNKYFGGEFFFKCNTLCSEEDMIMRFNKLSITTDASVKSSLLMSCMCSPFKTLTRVCQQGLANGTLLSDCLSNLTMMKSACFWECYDGNELGLNLISHILTSFVKREKLVDGERVGLVKLITRLGKNKILNDNFMEICIIETSREEIMNGNWDKVIFLLEILESCLRAKIYSGSKAVLMAYMSQVMNHTSWDSLSFNMQLANAREIAISVVKFLLRDSELSDDVELAWLRHEIMKLPAINQVYFCDLWYSHDSDFIASEDMDQLYVHLLLVLHSSRKSDRIDFIVSEFKSKKPDAFWSAFRTALIKLLPVLTSTEWASLMTQSKSIVAAWHDHSSDSPVDLEVLGLFATAMNCLARMTGIAETSFEYCIRIFGKVLLYTVLPPNGKKLQSVDILVDAMKSILCVLNVRRSHSLILAPVVFEIANCVAKLGLDADDEASVCVAEMEAWFRHCLLREGQSLSEEAAI